MTIYKPNRNKSEEKLKKGIISPPVVVLDGNNQIDALVGRRIVIATRRQQQRRVLCTCIMLVVFLIVTLAIFGGIFLYKNMTTNKPFIEMCTARYHEFQFASSPPLGDSSSVKQNGGVKRVEGEFYEQVEIDVVHGSYEKLYVPPLLSYKSSTILHDFEKNLTAIIDRDHARCFVLPLNKTTVQPPQSFYDLVRKLKSGYYLPDAEVVRENYRVVTPAEQDLSQFGYYIATDCKYYDTYKLVRENEPVAMSKRSTCIFAGEKFSLGQAGTPFMVCATFTGCL